MKVGTACLLQMMLVNRMNEGLNEKTEERGNEGRGKARYIHVRNNVTAVLVTVNITRE